MRPSIRLGHVSGTALAPQVLSGVDLVTRTTKVQESLGYEANGTVPRRSSRPAAVRPSQGRSLMVPLRPTSSTAARSPAKPEQTAAHRTPSSGAVRLQSRHQSARSGVEHDVFIWQCSFSFLGSLGGTTAYHMAADPSVGPDFEGRRSEGR
jgi:hypothetical protein